MMLSNDRYTVDIEQSVVVKTGLKEMVGYGGVRFINHFVAYRSNKSGKFFITMRKSDNEDRPLFSMFQRVGLHPKVEVAENQMLKAMKDICQQPLEAI